MTDSERFEQLRQVVGTLVSWSAGTLGTEATMELLHRIDALAPIGPATPPPATPPPPTRGPATQRGLI